MPRPKPAERSRQITIHIPLRVYSALERIASTGLVKTTPNAVASGLLCRADFVNGAARPARKAVRK